MAAVMISGVSFCWHISFFVTIQINGASRDIAIEFGDDDSAGMMYQLFAQEVVSLDEPTRTRYLPLRLLTSDCGVGVHVFGF